MDVPKPRYVSAPLLTEKEDVFLRLLLTLEKETFPELSKAFLTRSDCYLFHRNCQLKLSLPIVRFYMTICRLKGDITRVRKFLQDAFYYLNDRAVPICFVVLSNWVEVMPKWDKWQSK